MARLQILELPEGTSDDRPPFVLVVDQYEPVEATPSRLFRHQDMAEQIGARAVLVFENTIDIPANDLTLAHVQEATDGNVIRLRVEPDLEGFRERVEEEVLFAQGKLTQALKPADDAEDWHGILVGRRRQLTKALGINPLNDWDGILEAAAQMQSSRDGMRDAIQRVRDLHRPVEYRGMRICAECSAYDGNGSCDNSPAVYDQCSTTRATRDPQTASASRE